MSERPVFGSKFETDLWIQANKSTNQKDGGKAVLDLVNKAVSRGGTMHSAVLCELIDRVAEVSAPGWQSAVARLTALKRPEDTRPVLKAASMLAIHGFTAEAQKYLDGIQGGADLPMYHLVRGEVEAASGKKAEAVSDLKASQKSDPLNPHVYLLLAELEPSVDWSSVEACERMSRGMDYLDPSEGRNTPEYSLYKIYKEWYMGSRDNATRMLISSPSYKSKKPEFCLLSARMSRDEGDWHSAQMMYEEAAAGFGDSVSVLCEAGRAYLLGGDYESALSKYRSAEAFDQGSPVVLRGLIESYLRLGRSGEAMQIINEHLDSEMAGYEDYVLAATELIRIGHVHEATEFANRVLVAYPGDATACIVLSKAAVAEGNMKAAEDAATAAVHSNRGNPDALAQLSRVYLAMRETGKAVRFGRKAVKADEGSIPALLSLVEAYMETGDRYEAAELCKKVVSIDPANSEASEVLARLQIPRVGTDGGRPLPIVTGADDFIRLLGSLLSESNYREAARLCGENEEKFGSLAAVRRLRGNAEYALGEYLKASASFAAAAELMPDSAAVWHSKGMADEALGDMDSAEDAYNEAVLLDMNNPDYWASKGSAQEKNGDLKGAVESYNRAIELNPASAYPLVRKAVVLSNSGRYSEALNFMDLAEVTEPGSESVMKVRMRICLAAGRYNDVIYVGKKLMKKGKADPETVSIVIRADMGIGDTASAKKTIESALQKDPNSLDLLLVARDLGTAMGDAESVITICRMILKQSPEDRETKKRLADALFKAGRGEEATLVYSGIEKSEGPVSKAQTKEDAKAAIGIAKSLLQAGDVSGAGRMADRALAADPDNPEYILFRTEVYRRAGDSSIAGAFLAKSIQKHPEEARLYEASGDINVQAKDYEAAVSDYGEAVVHGLKTADVYLKLGRAQEASGDISSAIESYSSSVMLNPKDALACRRLAALQLRAHDEEGAIRSIEMSIAAKPTAGAYAILASVYQSRKDRDGVYGAYRGFVRYDDATDEDTARMTTALNSVGLRKEANALKGWADAGDAEPSADVPPAVKRCAERIMRRAYMLGSDVGDPDLMSSMGLDDETVRQAVAYLRDIPDYGEVIPGTPEYQKLETLSYNAVRRAKAKDIELMTVDTAYVAAGSKDADEAKLLLSYIRSARTSRLPREIPDTYRQMAAVVSKQDPLEDIMMDFKVGAFAARMIKSLAQRGQARIPCSDFPSPFGGVLGNPSSRTS